MNVSVDIEVNINFMTHKLCIKCVNKNKTFLILDGNLTDESSEEEAAEEATEEAMEEATEEATQE